MKSLYKDGHYTLLYVVFAGKESERLCPVLVCIATRYVAM